MRQIHSGGRAVGHHNILASVNLLGFARIEDPRGNCHDNAVAESFFQLLKREQISRQTYVTREAARQDVFEYIELFYNPKRKHTDNGMLFPVDFERRQQKQLREAGVQDTRGNSELLHCIPSPF